MSRIIQNRKSSLLEPERRKILPQRSFLVSYTAEAKNHNLIPGTGSIGPLSASCRKVRLMHEKVPVTT